MVHMCYKLIDRFKAEEIVSLALIGEFYSRTFHDFTPEIECCHKAKRVVISYLEEFRIYMTVMSILLLSWQYEVSTVGEDFANVNPMVILWFETARFSLIGDPSGHVIQKLTAWNWVEVRLPLVVWLGLSKAVLLFLGPLVVESPFSYVLKKESG